MSVILRVRLHEIEYNAIMTHLYYVVNSSTRVRSDSSGWRRCLPDVSEARSARDILPHNKIERLTNDKLWNNQPTLFPGPSVNPPCQAGLHQEALAAAWTSGSNKEVAHSQVAIRSSSQPTSPLRPYHLTSTDREFHYSGKPAMCTPCMRAKSDRPPHIAAYL